MFYLCFFIISVPPDTIIDDPEGVMYETTALEDQEQHVETTMDGASKIISITKKEPTEDQDPNESIKFAVKTRGSANEAPVEFEVELKDQKLIASGQLEDQTQTVRSFCFLILRVFISTHIFLTIFSQY